MKGDVSLRGPRFQLIPTRNGGWAWRFLVANNKTIASSTQTFADRDTCEDSIDSVRRLEPEIKICGPGAFTWSLKGAIIPIHAGKDVAMRTLIAFRDHAPSAPVQYIDHLRRPR